MVMCENGEYRDKGEAEESGQKLEVDQFPIFSFVPMWLFGEDSFCSIDLVY